MSKSRSSLTLLLALIAGCAATPAPTPAPEIREQRQEAPSVETVPVQVWLRLENATTQMSDEEVVAELVKLGKPSDAHEKFYFGLLNHQLDTYSNWRQARNAFREVRRDAEASPGLRQLAGIMERYNRTRVEDYKDRAQLLGKIDSLEDKLEMQQEERQLLEEKIQAITDVETSMSTRKEE